MLYSLPYRFVGASKLLNSSTHTDFAGFCMVEGLSYHSDLGACLLKYTYCNVESSFIKLVFVNGFSSSSVHVGRFWSYSVKLLST